MFTSFLKSLGVYNFFDELVCYSAAILGEGVWKIIPFILNLKRTLNGYLHRRMTNSKYKI